MCFNLAMSTFSDLRCFVHTLCSFIVLPNGKSNQVVCAYFHEPCPNCNLEKAFQQKYFNYSNIQFRAGAVLGVCLASACE